MKNFEEFKEYLDRDFFTRLEQTIKDINIALPSQYNESTKDDILSAIVSNSALTTVQVLREYHKWINHPDA